ncbi:unnamed protein product [Allacma fusca]|uniref:Cyclin-H n=1 Tax=Allacma fusca TaxID=39272 RepID=A0A8J2KGD0_9HEXA|nr:unnamed protein product [Allacma fusca]
MNESAKRAYFLTTDEEKIMLNYFEGHLKDFCSKFSPPMPKNVVGTACAYFKRFYLYNSVMDYHPKEILVTCVYLACKIEEFNVSIGQFVANVRGDREKATEIILNNELMLMSAMKFHLTIHNPYRPVEGFMIDIKTRFGQFDPEVLRPLVDEFLDKVLLTDVPLLFSPSQVALAAILQAASKSNQNLDGYVTEILISDKEMLQPVIDAIRAIRLIVRTKAMELPPQDLIRSLLKKLEKCRNQENNPENKLAQKNFEEEFD